MINKNDKNEELKTQIVAAVDKAPIPVSTQSIARKFGISWNRANRLLLILAAENKVSGTQTQLGFVFSPKQEATQPTA